MSEKKHDKPDLALDLSGLQSNKTNDSADYGVSPRRADDSSQSQNKNKGNLPDPRFISFQKEGSVGIGATMWGYLSPRCSQAVPPLSKDCSRGTR